MFTAKQLQDFKAYRKVQMGGKYNMFDPRATRATGLSESEYIFVLKNYVALQKEVDAGKVDN
jgi:hypothetical protein